MKKLFYLGILIIVASCTNNSKFTLTVKLDDVNKGMYYLVANVDEKWTKIDSAEIIDNVAVFERTSIAFPEIQYVQLKGQRFSIPVFVENADIEVIGDKEKSSKVIVEGSESHKNFDAYNESLGSFDQKIQSLYAEYSKASKEKNEEKINELTKEYEKLNGEKMDFIKDYVLNNPKSIVASFVAVRNIPKFELDVLEEFTKSFDKSIEHSGYVKQLNERVETLKKVAVGQKYTDFTMNDVEGNPVKLSSLVEGKYILLDFWASWCGPCRHENPNVVAVYNEFKGKGFDVVGISLDSNKEKWLKAIEDDKLTWHHLSDLAHWNSTAAKLYAVSGIPHSILLDSNGIIVAKNLRGEELREKVAELLN